MLLREKLEQGAVFTTNQARVPKRILSLLLSALLLAGLSLCFAAAAGEDGKEYIVKYREGAAPSSRDAHFDLVDGRELKRLLRAGTLEWYEEDGEAVLLEDPAPETGYDESLQWNLDVIHARGTLERGFQGQGVRVGVLDSGVNPHPALGDRLLPGCNYMEKAKDASDTSDRYGHGTKVAGLIAGADEDGAVGAAPMAEIVPLKITDGKNVKVSAVCRAVYGGIDDFGCSVLNMSLGISEEYQSLREAMDYAEEKGVTVVSAVGNLGKTGYYYPAAYGTVIGVGALGLDGEVYYHSNHNESVLLTAPGAEVRCTSSIGGYAPGSGTSFSVPQVSGAAAVLLGIDAALTPGEIRELLARTAEDRGAEGFDEYYGYGVLSVEGAVSLLLGEGPEEPAAPCAFFPESGPATQVRNFTDAPLSCTYLLAVYDETGLCLGVTACALTVPALGTAELDPPAENARFGQFLLETETMTPLTGARKSP